MLIEKFRLQMVLQEIIKNLLIFNENFFIKCISVIDNLQKYEKYTYPHSRPTRAPSPGQPGPGGSYDKGHRPATNWPSGNGGGSSSGSGSKPSQPQGSEDQTFLFG